MAEIRTTDGQKIEVKESKEEIDLIISSEECSDNGGILKLTKVHYPSKREEPASFIKSNIVMYE